MSTRIGNSHRVVTRKDGRTILVSKVTIPVEAYERAKTAVNYDPVTGAFTWKISCGRAQAGQSAGGRRGDKEYIYIRCQKRDLLAHRLAWYIQYGTVPQAYIDHINGKSSDNRIENLRVATPVESAANRRKLSNKKSSQFKGVYKIEGRKSKPWAVSMMLQGRIRHIGTYATEDLANTAYQTEAARVHGAFAEHLSRRVSL